MYCASIGLTQFSDFLLGINLNIKHFILLIFIVFQGCSDLSTNNTTQNIKHINSFTDLFTQAQNENKIIMLEMSATYCVYCKELEREIIHPMIISGDYEQVIIRKLEINQHHSIDLPNNESTTPFQFAHSKKVSVTPTLLFLNHKNEEVAKRIIGINSIDYFSAYVDDAIKTGTESIK